jgi:hypothetical protein
MASYGWPLGLFLIAVGLIIFSSFVHLMIVAEVNRKLPDDQQINYFFWYFAKNRRVMQLYRDFYPHGRMTFLYRACVGLAAIFGLAFLRKFGFFK